MAATKRKMDFTNVKEGSNFREKHVPEGDYEAKIVDVNDHTSRSGTDGWVFTVQLKGDERSKYPIYAGADEKQAWKIRKLFVAAGMQVPKKLVLVDPNKLMNKTIGVYMVEDEYEGRMKSKIDDFMPVSEMQAAEADEPDLADQYEDDIDEDEEPAPPVRKTRRKPEPEPEEDEDEDEEEPEPTPPPRRKRRAAAPVVEEEPDEDEEEEPAPVTTRRRRPTKRAAAKPAPVEEDDDDDLDLDEL